MRIASLKQFIVPTCMVVLLFVFQTANSVHADVYVMDDSTGSHVDLGDFECSCCFHQFQECISLMPGSDVTTGSLWRQLDRTGVKSVNQLTLCLDLGDQFNRGQVDVDSVDFVFRGKRSNLEHFSLDRNGDNSIVVPIHQTSSKKPEVKLVANLGYDFMKRFSNQSSEQILLNVKLKDGTILQPNFFIAHPKPRSTANSRIFMTGFVIFWCVMFFALYKLTHPAARKVAMPELVKKPLPITIPNGRLVDPKITT